MRKILQSLLIVIVLSGIGFGLYYDSTRNAIWRYQVIEEQLSDPRIPSSMNDLRILYLSDLHYTGNLEELNNLTQLVLKQKADIILFGGDLIDEGTLIEMKDQKVLELIEWLKQFQAPLGSFAILGKDDLKQLSLIETIYHQAQIEILDDSSVILSRNQQTGIQLSSIRQNPQSLSPDTSLYQLVLIYDPELSTQLPQNIDLIIAAKTHGGEVNLPFIGSLYDEAKGKYVKGEYTVNQNRLLISNGLGSVLKARFRSNPSLYLFTLKHPVEKPAD